MVRRETDRRHDGRRPFANNYWGDRSSVLYKGSVSTPGRGTVGVDRYGQDWYRSHDYNRSKTESEEMRKTGRGLEGLEL